MYKVLIVEDEMLVRIGLRNSVAWSDYGMRVIADVSNGQDAYIAYENDRPDIIITDLRMPGMGGMELIETIRKSDNKTIIIILSCLDEFDQVKKAMSLNVFDYIFKLTMTNEEITRILIRVKENLDKQNEDSKNSSLTEEDLEFIKELILKEYILYNKLNEQEFNTKIDTLHLRLSSKGLVLCVLEIDNLVELHNTDKTGSYAIKNSILKEINRILEEFGSGEVFFDRENRYVILFSDIDKNNQTVIGRSILFCMNKIHDEIFNIYNARISIGMSEKYNGYSSLKNMLKQARKVIGQRFILGSGVYKSFEYLASKKVFLENIQVLKNASVINRILNDDYKTEYYEKLEDIEKMYTSDIESIIRRFKNLLQWSATNSVVDADITLIVPYLEKMDKCTTLECVVSTYIMYCNLIYSNKSNNSLHLGETISCAIEYISNNFSQNLNLHIVAEEVVVSPTYLSNLFKKKLNINFVDYLNNIRVEKAKSLLEKTELRSYEIADKVGFADTSYFSKVFKKYSGKSPNKYRKFTREM